MFVIFKEIIWWILHVRMFPWGFENFWVFFLAEFCFWKQLDYLCFSKLCLGGKRSYFMSKRVGKKIRIKWFSSYFCRMQLVIWLCKTGNYEMVVDIGFDKIHGEHLHKAIKSISNSWHLANFFRSAKKGIACFTKCAKCVTYSFLGSNRRKVMTP